MGDGNENIKGGQFDRQRHNAHGNILADSVVNDDVPHMAIIEAIANGLKVDDFTDEKTKFITDSLANIIADMEMNPF